ncbi:DUF4190 domain-containing protein, partial [Streptomyces buecherae]|uniref:DUF4190 domain-containing protein n=2 Tax=Streptomyces buecherae TaxID=2763006 RepID=UPI001C9BA2A8
PPDHPAPPAVGAHSNWPGYPPYRARPARINGMTVAALVLGVAWLFWIGSAFALGFGYVARQQIRERGEGGWGMATAGVVLGWVAFGLLGLSIAVAIAEPAPY